MGTTSQTTCSEAIQAIRSASGLSHVEIARFLGSSHLEQAHASLLFQAICERYEKRQAIILTSNKAFADWGEVFAGDTIMASGAVTTVYILTQGNQQLTELDAGQWAHSNVYAPGGRLLATYDGPGQASPGYHYNLTDWLGTKRMQTTSGGNQQQTCLSNPFGDGLSCTGGADATEQHFTGKDRDVESGLDYFGARYYSSMLGRFLTPDWATKPAAVPYASFGDPQSLNLYAYVRNNPMTGIDADGHVNSYDPTSQEVDTGDPLASEFTGEYSGDLYDQAAASTATSSGSGQTTTANGQPAAPTPPGDSGSAQQQSSSSTATQHGHFEYDQKTGQMTHVLPNGSRVVVGTGYSGNGKGLNNPSEQYTPNVGPIPQGSYTIAPQQNNVT